MHCSVDRIHPLLEDGNGISSELLLELLLLLLGGLHVVEVLPHVSSKGTYSACNCTTQKAVVPSTNHLLDQVANELLSKMLDLPCPVFFSTTELLHLIQVSFSQHVDGVHHIRCYPVDKPVGWSSLRLPGVEISIVCLQLSLDLRRRNDR